MPSSGRASGQSQDTDTDELWSGLRQFIHGFKDILRYHPHRVQWKAGQVRGGVTVAWVHLVVKSACGDRPSDTGAWWVAYVIAQVVYILEI